MFRNCFFVVLLVCVCNTATAGKVTYNCEVKHLYDLGHNGDLVPSHSGWSRNFVGVAFTVSRITGEITGSIVPTLLTPTTRVISKGSKDWSFRAVADFGNTYQLIEVQEFRLGPTKPFLVSSMGGTGIVTGLCQ